mgnify:FL=1
MDLSRATEYRTPMDRRARTTGSVTVVLLVVCCLAAATLGGTASAQSALVPQTDDQPAPDNTITRIDLAADGSATWEITLRTRLENDSDIAEYERFQEQFRANTSRYLDPFSERMSGVVAAANQSSDREMRAEGFNAETDIQEVPRRWGVVSFRFTWTGFAAVEDDAVVAGDVFAGGFFIGTDDALAISAPDGYMIESAAPEPDETSESVVEWRGREDFDDGHPSVRAVPIASGDGGGGSSPDGDNSTLLVALGLLVLIGAVGAGAYAVRTGRLTLGGGGAADGDATARTAGGETNDGDASADETVDPDASGSAPDDPEPANRPDAVDVKYDSADAVDNETAAIDPDLLTDEDRVRQVLAERGGRMKQSAIVDEFDWSKSKASRVISRMAEDGDVEKLRIGRENVIDLVEES